MLLPPSHGGAWRYSVKLNKCRHLLACSCLVLFLGFGWFDSLRLFWDYLFLASAPVASQSVEGTQTITVQEATGSAGGSQTTAPATSNAGPQCPGCAKPRPPRPPGPPGGN